jgi:hypothetical protein
MSNLDTVNGLIRTNIFISVIEKNEFKRRAQKEGVSYATLIRRAMAQFLGTDVEQFECAARRGMK